MCFSGDDATIFVAKPHVEIQYLMKPALGRTDSSTMYNLLLFLIVTTWTERVACCVDFDSDCALVDEIRSSAHVFIFPGTKLYYCPSHLLESLDSVCLLLKPATVAGFESKHTESRLSSRWDA